MYIIGISCVDSMKKKVFIMVLLVTTDAESDCTERSKDTGPELSLDKANVLWIKKHSAISA